MAAGLSGDSPTGMITRHLKDIDFPASREELVAHMRRHTADGVIASLMEMLPKRSYESVGEVMQALTTGGPPTHFNGTDRGEAANIADLAPDEDEDEYEEEEEDVEDDDEEEEEDDEEEEEDEEGDEEKEG